VASAKPFVSTTRTWDELKNFSNGQGFIWYEYILYAPEVNISERGGNKEQGEKILSNEAHQRRTECICHINDFMKRRQRMVTACNQLAW
jgi:hypothetical protein